MQVRIVQRYRGAGDLGPIIAVEPTVARARFQAESDRAALGGSRKIGWLESGFYAAPVNDLPGYTITTWDVEEVGR